MLPAKTLSAVEAISPAFERAQALFKPFRFRHWARLAFVALLTGEFASSSCGSGNYSIPTRTGKKDLLSLAGDAAVWETLRTLWPLLVAGVVALLAIGLIFSYIESVFRFILLDSVLTGRSEIGAGWRRWQEKGTSYFLWQLFLSLVLLALLAAVVGWPLYSAWKAGVFDKASENVAALLAGGLGIFAAAFGVILLGMLVATLAKDFVIPLMAVENLRATEAWRRFLPMLGSEKGSYAVYILMKIVLSVGSAILFGIVNVFAFLFLLIPLGVIGVVVFLIARAAGLGWTAWTITGAVGLGLLAFGAIFYVACFLYVPGLVFFQSYPLYFLSGRVPRLGVILSPPPPEPAAPPAPATPQPAPPAPA